VPKAMTADGSTEEDSVIEAVIFDQLRQLGYME
jgi:hypothetical protein